MPNQFILFTIICFFANSVSIPSFANRPKQLEITYDRSVSPQIQNDIESQINFLKKIQLSRSTLLNQKIFGPRFQQNLYFNFVVQRIQKVRQSVSMHGGYLMVAGADLHPHEAIVNSDYFSIDPQISYVMKAMILVHEARHNEAINDHWAHQWCPYPFVDENGQDIRSIFSGELLSRTESCDETATGAIGTSIIAARNVEKYCDSCSDFERAEAKKFADDMMNRITNWRATEALIRDAE